MVCKNLCLRYGVVQRTGIITVSKYSILEPQANMYDMGYRYCSGCTRYFLTTRTHCICCGWRLRIRGHKKMADRFKGVRY